MKKAAAAAAVLATLLLSSAVSPTAVSGQQPWTNQQTAANNPRLHKAYVALQALKRAITEDPRNLTRGWCGPDVCAYFGVYCAAAPDGDADTDTQTVAGLDLNHGDLAGTLPEELGLLADLALLHLNSNRFAGTLPDSLPALRLLHELDVSNNRLSGGFPRHVLCLPNLRYVDLRFNRLRGPVPPALFDKPLDAVFLNDNLFDFELPESLGNSPASVLVLANLRLRGCIPRSVARMADTLNELVLLNAGLRSCVPPELGCLRDLTVLDLSFNQLQGTLPESMAAMRGLQQLDVAHNQLWGHIPEGVCALPGLRNFTYSDNYFCTQPQRCLHIRRVDDRHNCIAARPDQRPADQCLAFLHRPPVHCDDHGCFGPPPHY
ncbi:Leucine-rich repeat extensin-like protein 4 [Zea mays]|uniref:Cell wall hydroxyproline-rich glycoprotein n=1 Tax=Zea mays TaxID=4577 RepID=A0A3L6E2R4_MAIZE|nr:Leucine-rich repeat extensin-like protein 4 [Zea mays]